MAHHYLNYCPDQGFLLSPNPVEWLPSDSLAYQVYDILSELDFSLLHASYSRDGRGAPAFAPQMLFSICLYAQYKGVFSSRGIKRLCIEDLGARYLCGGSIPDHRSINQFKLRHGAALKPLFVQSVHLCQKAGMVSLIHNVTDGTKVPGRASKSSNRKYSRIVEEEAQVSAEVDKLLQRGLDADAAEDAQFGSDYDGFSLPEHLNNRQKRRDALRAAKASLEAEAKSKEVARKEKWDNTKPSERPHRKTPDPEKAVPSADERFNFVDPESRLMKARGRYIQGYNAQASVDSANQVIVACDVTSDCNDYHQLTPLVEQSIENTGERPKKVLADAGYFSDKNIEDLDKRNLTALIPPDNAWQRDRTNTELLCPEEVAKLTPKQRQHYLVTTEEGRAEYAHRMKTIEPVFGQIKGNPGHPGFLHFLRCGRKRCQQDWNFGCMGHNIRKLMRFRAKQESQKQESQKQESQKQESQKQEPAITKATITKATRRPQQVNNWQNLVLLGG